MAATALHPRQNTGTFCSSEVIAPQNIPVTSINDDEADVESLPASIVFDFQSLQGRRISQLFDPVPCLTRSKSPTVSFTESSLVSVSLLKRWWDAYFFLGMNLDGPPLKCLMVGFFPVLHFADFRPHM